jgi:PAS domain-containing protein
MLVGGDRRMSTLFDRTLIGDEGAMDFMTNILESSTEYSIIGKNLDGTIVLWNEGARRLYGYASRRGCRRRRSNSRTPTSPRIASSPACRTSCARL